MDKVSEQITTIDPTEQLHVCPKCGYQRGFHISFGPKAEHTSQPLILICPNCGARYEVGKLI